MKFSITKVTLHAQFLMNLQLMDLGLVDLAILLLIRFKNCSFIFLSYLQWKFELLHLELLLEATNQDKLFNLLKMYFSFLICSLGLIMFTISWCF